MSSFGRFAFFHITAGLLITLAALLVIGTILSSLSTPREATPVRPLISNGKTPTAIHAVTETGTPRTGPATAHGQPANSPAAAPPHTAAPAQPAHARSPAAPHAAPAPAPQVQGVAFVTAMIEPLHFELNERFYGWRPNDILDFTDNVNNMQLGMLEVTRRTAVILTERLSRTGSTASFDKNLENAMNWFMITADRYWFPSPESRYSAGLEELGKYRDKLLRGEASFFTRTDNLIPLLAAYEDLLGSCDENLVKATEDDSGQAVSFFRADDYFYYAKGVASAMLTILEAVAEDFALTVESRRGTEVLHHAIASCRRATQINPWIVTDSSLDGVFANHRANMAAPVSHARFYLGLLIKTLST